MSNPAPGAGAPRRFYAAATTAAVADGGYGVRLDAMSLRTPAGAIFRAPTEALAAACAAEWAAQTEIIRPGTMPLTRLANVALDRGDASRAELADQIAAYAGTDLIAHRAESPERLVRRQAETWEPLVVYAREALALPIAVVTGVARAPEAAAAEARARALALALDAFRLVALAHGVGLSGSAVIGFALMQGQISAEAAFQAAALDELYQAEVWGEDAEARARLDRLRADLADLARFFAALAPTA